jgi:hypothetical protein
MRNSCLRNHRFLHDADECEEKVMEDKTKAPVILNIAVSPASETAASAPAPAPAPANGDRISPREQMLLDYTTCCLCGGELIFTHITSFVNNEVIEQSACGSCRVKHVTKTHALM